MTITRPLIPTITQLEHRDPATLVPDPENARKHTKKQIAILKKVIQEFGFVNPILIDENLKVLSGHARLQAALELPLKKVPCLPILNLSEGQKRALAVAQNRLGDMSYFDPGQLAKTLSEICSVEFDVELTGFTSGEVDVKLTPPGLADPKSDPADSFVAPDLHCPALAQLSDLWRLGRHILYCGDARSEASYQALLGENRAALVIADPPFNLPIAGHVSGLGATTHADFAMASGEMTPKEYETFLRTFMKLSADFSVDGSLHYVFIDWSHLREILAASDHVYSEQKALLVWNKTNGGMGSFYRSKHELIFVLKNGAAPHVNNIDLGKHGRYRTNVLDYPGANAFGPTRAQDLADHPTVKPLALVADIIRDACKRNAIVLDPFAGSGTTILAAERTGRKAAAIEIDPHYVDVAIKRWQAMTGGKAFRAADGRTFGELLAASNFLEAQGE